jgi:hypothetical protein
MDGWYFDFDDASNQMQDLKRDYPKGKFCVVELKAKNQEHLEIGGRASDDFNRMIHELA